MESKFKSNLLLYLLQYVEAFVDFAWPFSASLCLWATQLFLKKSCSNGELLATLCLIRLAVDLNLKPPAPETIALLLNQLASKKSKNQIGIFRSKRFVLIILIAAKVYTIEIFVLTRVFCM